MMKKMYLFMTMISLMLLASCQQDENLETGKEDVTIAGLEKEFGITFSDECEAGVPATFLSLEELNEFLREFKKLEGKPIQVPVAMAEALTRGPGESGIVVPRPGKATMSEDNIYLYKMIGISLDYIYDVNNVKANGSFDTYIYFMENNVYCYQSFGRKTVYDIAYGDKQYVSLVNPDCKFSFWTQVPGTNNMKYTTVSFKLQVDWERKANAKVCEMTLSYPTVS